jgi:multiple sugar transport system substrate-binding protein
MKRIALVLIAAILISALSIGCAQPSQTNSSSDSGLPTQSTNSAGKIELTFWNPFTGSDGPYLQKIIDNFNNENKGSIEIVSQTMQANDMYSKLPVVYNSGKGIPDLCIIHIERIPGFVDKDMLTPMNEIVDEIGFDKKDFIPTLWNATEINGIRYSVPLDTHPIFVYYNRKMLTELGYTEDDLKGLDYDNFMEMAKKATTGDKVGFGMPFTWLGNVFMTILYQHGGKMVSMDDPSKALYNSAEGIEALEKLKSIVDEGVTNQPGVDAGALFKDGKALFTVDGIWAVGGMDEVEGLDWGAMFWPLFGEKLATWASSHNIVMFKQNKIDSEKTKAITKFIKYLSENSLEWAKAGQIPANVNVINSDEFKNLKWGFAAEHLDVFTYPDPVTTYSTIESPIWQMLTEVLEGRLGVKEGIDSAAKESSQKAEEALK